MPYQPTAMHQLNFVKKISDDDWMYRGKTSHGYFLRGYEALSVCHLAIKRAGARPRRILDFGCGHGCVARMLKAQYTSATIYGQDVDSNWLAWCADHLGIETIQSSPRISDVEVPTKSYDVIWVGSVFTHIPERNFDHLLQQLVSGLDESGLLIFTTAGHRVWQSFDPQNERLLSPEEASDAVRDYEETGYGFAPYVNGTHPEWGRTLTAFSKVLEKIGDAGGRMVSFQEGGWGNRQDVYSIVRQ